MFEKIVFYVAPRYGNADPVRLQRAASEFSFQFNETGTYLPVRMRRRRRRKKQLLLALALIAAAVGAAVLCFIL